LSYNVRNSDRGRANAFLTSLPQKSQKVIEENLKKLINNPFPGDFGDKEKLDLPINLPVYRMHIGRSYTAFYQIDLEHKTVKIDILTTIQQAHKLYRRYG
jgi:mRNA-degrading endonuclease RelE of RelBE toxin-antitoxin system